MRHPDYPRGLPSVAFARRRVGGEAKIAIAAFGSGDRNLVLGEFGLDSTSRVCYNLSRQRVLGSGDTWKRRNSFADGEV